MSAWERYWSAGVSRTGLDLFRTAFLGVVAVDAFLGLAQAAGYGAGGFNVSQLPGLDPLLPLPSRWAIAACCLLGAFLAVRAALGVAVTTSILLLTALSAYRHLISQLDSQPHHYLIVLLLLISCAIPWARPTPPDGQVRHRAIRLLIVQAAIVYLWSAVATLPRPLAALQLGLCLMLLVRWFWPVALLAGIALHVGLELAGLRSGLFNHVMIAFHLLLVPHGWLAAPRRALGSLRRLAVRLPGPGAATGIATALTLTGAALIALTPFEGAIAIAALAAVLGAGTVAMLARARAGARPLLHAGAAHLLAGATILALHAGTDQASAYYRRLGGTARRLGDHATAELAYRRLLRMHPGEARIHYHLGSLALQRDATDEALAHFRTAQAGDPAEPAAFEAEAQMLAAGGRHEQAIALLQACQRAAPGAAGCAMKEALSLQALGRSGEAIAAARRAVGLDPRHQGARAVLRALTGDTSSPPPADPFAGDRPDDDRP